MVQCFHTVPPHRAADSWLLERCHIILSAITKLYIFTLCVYVPWCATMRQVQACLEANFSTLKGSYFNNLQQSTIIKNNMQENCSCWKWKQHTCFTPRGKKTHTIKCYSGGNTNSWWCANYRCRHVMEKQFFKQLGKKARPKIHYFVRILCSSWIVTRLS